MIDTDELLTLSRQLTGHLATVESVRHNVNVYEEQVAGLKLSDADRLGRIRREVADALSDEGGVGRARWLLVRDIGYVVEARERAFGADRTDGDERHVLDLLVASVAGGTTKAGQRKLRRLLAGLVSPRGGEGGGSSGSGGGSSGSKGSGGGSSGGHPKSPDGMRDLSEIRGKAWGGSMAPFTQFITPFLGKLGLHAGSAKRATRNTAGGGVSDHWIGKKDAYATDYPTTNGAGPAGKLARALGIKGWQPGSYTSYTVTIGGRQFRTQILWAVPGHFDHIHVGLQRI